MAKPLTLEELTIKYCPIKAAGILAAGGAEFSLARCWKESCAWWYENGCRAHPGPVVRYQTTASSPSTEATEKRSISS